MNNNIHFYNFRSITKILGEWWANLDKEEKACYTGLAKQVHTLKYAKKQSLIHLRNALEHQLTYLSLFLQYKDAFFSANPDFKWYKLPAPPLRTLSSRPRDQTDKQVESPTNEHHDHELEKTNNNSTKVDFNKKPRDDIFEDPKPLSMFTPGKLADEAQMGGLSSLLATKTETQTTNPYYSPPCFKLNAISSEYRSHNLIERAKAKGQSEESIRELQNALNETTKVFEEDFDDEKRRIYYGIHNEMYTNQDVIDQIVDKRYSKDDEYGYQRNWSDDEKNMRSGRSCKGKRYQEFMAVGGLIVNKRQKRDSDKPDENYSAACSWDPGSARSDESFTSVNDDPKQSCSLLEKSADSDDKTDTIDGPDPDNNSNKTFKAADFDLDAKIRALPSLSLEKFQQKKRENKRKKKTINLKPKALESSHIINSVPRSMLEDRRDVENWRDTVIGSQKRKPRKISITRLEINSMVSSVDLNEAHKISPEIKIATEAPCTVVQNMEICKQSQHSVDLLALATLAEVAANTSKLDDTSIIDNLTAKASDHASMV